MIPVGADSLPRAIPYPLPSHPGNIFLAGEPVAVAAPPGEVETWRAVDYDDNPVANGLCKNGMAEIGPLPAGWYKIMRDAGQATNEVFLGVLEPLRAPTPLSSPIGIDVAAAWFYPDARLDGAINLCRLAGMNWVRDRLLWSEIEPRRGEFATHTRYDEAVRAQTSAGLQVLDVHHLSAGWATTNSARFPPDLRDIYNFYRELAHRWQGQLAAFEPWNEADIKEFGGHTGSEMATLQKAAWLGLKAGNPGLAVCQNVFAIHRLATLRDFQDNEAWPYFDTFNLHHYEPFENYPKLYQDFRSVSAGKPLWVTECNVAVHWKGDAKLQEPSEADLRVQSERVPKIYSMAIHEGAQAVFYFMLPHYVESQTQFGVLRPDLTPRPAFLALAAAGRLLADAKPLGRVRSEDPAVQGYLFAAKADGREGDILVIWSDHEATFVLPEPPVACFDHLGRPRSLTSSVLRIGRAPLYIELAQGSCPAMIAPPKPTKVLTGHPGTVVMQALLPDKDIVADQSAYHLAAGREMTIPIFIYNFGAKTVRGKLLVKAPDHWAAQMAPEVQIEPGGRQELTLRLTHPEMAGITNAGIRIHGNFGYGGGKPVLAFRLTSSTQ
jgi:hypothetical protein